MAAKKTTKRACTICQKAGHNQRTCPDKPPKTEDGMEAAPPARSSSVSLATIETVHDSPSHSHSAHMPLEFVENSQQVFANGIIMKLTTREYEVGVPSYILRHTPQDKTPIEIAFDQAALSKVYELIGSALQRTAVSGGKTLPAKTHVNGVSARLESR